MCKYISYLPAISSNLIWSCIIYSVYMPSSQCPYYSLDHNFGSKLSVLVICYCKFTWNIVRRGFWIYIVYKYISVKTLTLPYPFLTIAPAAIDIPFQGKYRLQNLTDKKNSQQFLRYYRYTFKSRKPLGEKTFSEWQKLYHESPRNNSLQSVAATKEERRWENSTFLPQSGYKSTEWFQHMPAKYPGRPCIYS